jgi:hypothetical protein
MCPTERIGADGLCQPHRTMASSRLKIDSRHLAPLVILKIVGYLLILIERSHAGAFDGRNVHECVVAATFGYDETETLGGIEEFYFSNRHMDILCPMSDGHAPTAAHPGFLRLERDKEAV